MKTISSTAIKSFNKSLQNKNGSMPEVSVISLDAMKPLQKLNPGTPLTLAPGVTLSVLQTASEALLEIDATAADTTLVGGKRTSELTTVQTGQIIKTSEGQYVMVRHMESFIVPRAKDELRSPDVTQVINDISKIMANDSAQETKPAAWSSFKMPTLSRRTLVRVAIASISVGIFGLYLKQGATTTDSNSGTSSGPKEALSSTETAKSRIVSTQVNTEVQKNDEANERTPAHETTTPVDTKIDPLKKSKVQEENSNKEKLVTKPVSLNSSKPKQSTTSTQEGLKSEASQANAKSIRLTEKDRVTITEYRLEAKFDRGNARAKLKHFANSFPEGSPARREVEKAYNGL